jgi:hypothetical protein
MLFSNKTVLKLQPFLFFFHSRFARRKEGVRSKLFFFIILLCISCPGMAVSQQNTAPYTGNGGKGITIAVPAPVLQNHSASDAWIPQLFQDTITGDLVRYSAMTVIDRSNEDLALSEQRIAATGNYSDEDYIKMGNLTNAHYIVAGKITKMAGNYSVSFRINHTESNEIKTAFDKTYPLKDIESGLASKEAVRELLAGMGVQLTEAGEQSLLAIQETKVRASAELAKGMAAEKNGNLVGALAHFTGAVEADSNMKEASVHIQTFAGAVPTGSIRERAEFAIAQKQKWEKIFADLKVYVWEKLPIFIYDFSVVEDKFDARSNKVTITVSPGVKIVPDRTVLLVYKTILDNWIQIKNMEENKGWTGTVSIPAGVFELQSVSQYAFSYEIGLYDDYGDRIASFEWDHVPGFDYSYHSSSFQVLAQHKYYNDNNFNKIRFVVPLEKITDIVTPKIERIHRNRNLPYPNNRDRIEYPVFTVEEWQEWLASQGGTGN